MSVGGRRQLFPPFEGRVRAILSAHPEMAATVIVDRVGWALGAVATFGP
jgi:hypothetical protein